MQSDKTPEERALQRALAAVADKKTQASLRRVKPKRAPPKPKPSVSTLAVAPPTLLEKVSRESLQKQVCANPTGLEDNDVLKSDDESDDDDEETSKIEEEEEENGKYENDNDEDDVFDKEGDVEDSLDADGLPSLIRMMTMRSIDEDDPTQSDTDDDEDENNIFQKKEAGDVSSGQDTFKTACDANDSDDGGRESLGESGVSSAAPMNMKKSASSLVFPPIASATATATARNTFSGEAGSANLLLSPIRKKTTMTRSQGGSGMYSVPAVVDSTVLDGVQVRKYFGSDAKNSFSNKVLWMNRQHGLHDVPLNLLSLTAASPNSFKRGLTQSQSKVLNKHPRKIKRKVLKSLNSSVSSRRSRGSSIRSSRTLDRIVDSPRSDSDESMSSMSSMCSMRSGISISHETRNQLIFDDHNDLDADVYVNHIDYKRGSGLDIENLLHHLTTEKGKDRLRNKLILDTVCKREESAQALINAVRATTPDVTAIPSQGCGLNEVQSSPRSMYIAGCLTHHLNPRASHVIRKDISQQLHLEHFGMGDDLAIQLAEGIRELPMLYYINISDNNLTDRGMKALLSSVMHMPMLFELDMSDNIIGKETAAALQIFLHQENNTCPLRSLTLKNANVDDYEGAMFIRALHNNYNLTSLDLSKNLIGGAEILNVVRPDLITAVESLADLIRNPLCVLKSIKLAWNNVRLDSAVYFAKALQVNTSILTLDLSYNSLGDAGGRAIGEALLDNSTLVTLLLSNNNIGPAASFIICTAVEQNNCLRKLVLDGNPIGEAGAKSIMNLTNVVGSRLDISATDCNVCMRDESCWFNESDPCRKYRLKMSDSFERAVAFKLLTVCAHHHSYDFVKFSHEVKGAGGPVKIELRQKLLREKIKFLTKKEKKVLSSLYKIKDAAKDVRLAQQLFLDYDTDHTGVIDMTELSELLDSFGMKVKKSQLGDAMAIIDVDGSGGIELPEFLNFIRDHQNDAISRIKEMTEVPAMVEKDSKSKYVPPKTGTLIIELRDSYVKKAHFQVMTASDQKNVSKLAARIGSSPAQLIGYSLCNSKLRLVEAYEFYEAMIRDTGSRARVLSHILPHMIVPAEARTLVSKVTQDEPTEVNFVRIALGNALRPIFGLPCGYYCLEFSKEMDRICLSKLLEMEGVISALRRENDPYNSGFVGDTSQARNWSSFRNAMLNGSPVRITSALFTPMPKTGKLEFDFSGSIRPTIGQTTMTDSKLTKILINLALLDIEKKQECFDELRQMTCDLDAVMNGNGKVYAECSRQRAERIALAADKFYQNIHNRGRDIAAARRREEIKHDFTLMHEQVGVKGASRGESMTNMDPFMKQADDTSGLIGGHVGDNIKPMKRIGTSLMSRLKAKRCAGLFAGHGGNIGQSGHFASHGKLGALLEKPVNGDVGSSGDEDEDDSVFFDEEQEQENALKLAVQQAIHERESRLHVRRQSRALLKIEALQLPSSNVQHSSTDMEKDVEDGKKEEEEEEERFVTLPAIVVMRNGKEITYPSVSIPKSKHANGDVNSEMTNDDQGGGHSSSINNKNSKHDDAPAKPKFYDIGKNVMAALDVSKQFTAALRNATLDRRTLQQTRNRRKLRDLITANNVLPDAKGIRLRDQILDIMGSYWIRAKHVAMLLKCFASSIVTVEKYYGSYRVDIVVSLFSRLVDIHNFEVILNQLSSTEAACVYARIGWLNIFNPMKPEGAYELMMSRWEERMVAKILLSLACQEPGENIVHGSFQWDRESDKVPGWVVTQSWLSDDSMQRKGYLTLTYGSKQNCSATISVNFKPDITYRRAFLSAVLIREEELIPEHQSNSDVIMIPPTPGRDALLREASYKNHWMQYLYGDKDIDSRVTKLMATKASPKTGRKTSST